VPEYVTSLFDKGNKRERNLVDARASRPSSRVVKPPLFLEVSRKRWYSRPMQTRETTKL
jgi:hypothetical protein